MLFIMQFTKTTAFQITKKYCSLKPIQCSINQSRLHLAPRYRNDANSQISLEEINNMSWSPGVLFHLVRMRLCQTAQSDSITLAN